MASLTYRALKPGERFIFDPSHPFDPPGQYNGQEPLLQLWETNLDGKLAGCVMALPLRAFFRASCNVNSVDGMQVGDVHLNSKQAKRLESALRDHHNRDYQIAVPKKHRLAIGEFKKRVPGLDTIIKPVISRSSVSSRTQQHPSFASLDRGCKATA
jgi:hypothetical protein